MPVNTKTFTIHLVMVLYYLVSATTLAQEAEMTNDQAIAKYRMGTLTIHAQPGADVQVLQLRHEFMFGTAIASHMFKDNVDPAVQAKYLDIIRNNFNVAVHENAMKWYSTQRHEGPVSYETADRILDFCQQNDIAMRGHCLAWAVDKFVQDWVKQLDDEQLREQLEHRIREVTTRYRGRIIEYDVNNEMLHGRYYADRLGDSIRVDMFKWAHEVDPDARLFVNDYGILPGGKWTDLYIEQIRWLIDNGAPLGGIGCQGHFSDKWPPDAATIKTVLDQLAQFNLPIVITEYDMTHYNVEIADEQVKADALKTVYETAFAHPAVSGILMWGFWEGAHWRPNAALWKKDFTPTPAAETYQQLVFDKWWTRFSGKTGDDGVCVVPVFFGQHEVIVDGKTYKIAVHKNDKTAELKITP